MSRPRSGDGTTWRPVTCFYSSLGSMAESTPSWLVCPGRGSNPHGLAASDVTDRRVYQFHRPGTRIRAGVLVAATRPCQAAATSRAQGGGFSRIGVIGFMRGGGEKTRRRGCHTPDGRSAAHTSRAPCAHTPRDARNRGRPGTMRAGRRRRPGGARGVGRGAGDHHHGRARRAGSRRAAAGLGG